MYSKVTIGYDDGDMAERASIVARVVGAEAAVAAAQAASVRALADAAAYAARVTRSEPVRDRDMALRSIAAEIACAGRLSDRTVQRRIDDADVLVSGYPQTVTAWAEGRISQGHVRCVVDAGTPLDDADRALLDAAAVPVCEAETAAGARHLLETLAEELNPRTFTERHRDARESRSVRVAPLPDGMAELIVILPVTLARAIRDRLTRQAREIVNTRERARVDTAEAAAGVATGAVETGGESDEPTFAEIVASDTRTIDQIRTDVLADMLLTGCPGNDPTATGDGPGELGAIRAIVQVTVPVLDLIGATDGEAVLDDRSPVDADTARRLAGGASGFDLILTHPVTGTVLAVDRYTPTSTMQRFLRGRDQHCRFPGCRMPAVRCDIDHTHDHAHGGKTDLHNLAHLCRRHHTLKHATPWTVTQHPDGILQWTSPLGHTYIDQPPTIVGATTRALAPRTQHRTNADPPGIHFTRGSGSPGVHFIPDEDPPPF
jgi:hypothetical protein